MSNAYVSWSTRYECYALVDGNGRQLFADNRPLVYTTREHAYVAVRTEVAR